MKKLICIILALSVIGCCFGTAYADEALESLTLSVKSRLEIPEEYTKFQTSRGRTETEEIVSFEWKTEDNKRISAQALSDGIITDYSNSEVNSESGISRYSSEEAADAANRWMEKINLSVANQFVFKAENVNLGYGMSARADRYINGVRVDGDDAYISMDSRTGKVSYFCMTYTKYDFDKTEGIITYEQAAEKFGEKTKLMLGYKNIGGGKAIPVYVNFEGRYEEDFGVDAFTGEYIECGNRYYRASGGAIYANAVMKQEDAADEMSLTETELIELSKYDNCISKEKAEEIVKGVKEFGISDYKADSVYYEKLLSYASGEEKELGITVSVYLTNGENDAYARLNAKTGEILEFYSYCETDTDKTVSEEQMEKTADNAAAKVFKNRKYIKAAAVGNQFVYLQDINGIPYIDSSASVTVSETTGYITNFYTHWENDDVTFEPCENPIDMETAHKTYIEESEYELVYKDIYGFGAMPVYKTETAEKIGPLYKLLYCEKSAPYCINALTGKANTNFGEEYKEKPKSFNDIEGHWSEKAVKALVDNGFLSIEEESFKPDNNITVKEAREMLNSADLYQYSFDSDDDKMLLREEAVKAVVCGAGYEKAGALSDIYLPVFADWNNISYENKGYAALAKGMGVVSGDQNGNLNPKANVTKGAFAVMIYNYIINN